VSQTAIKFSFSAHFFDTVRLALRIKSLPSLFLPHVPPAANVHARLVENGVEFCPIRIRYACRNQCATSTNAFGVSVTIFFLKPSLRKRNHDAARSAALR